MLQEFKKFAMKGNVLDLAIGVIIGAAFGKIVTSLVNDLIMPILGIFIGGVDFTKLSYSPPFGESVILYGQFIQTVFDFLIVAFSIFLFVQFMNKRIRKKEEESTPESPEKDAKEELLIEIRDLLQKQEQNSLDITKKQNHES
ncbi:large conductance mechanosensitive channel protein MscL [Cytobacillus sp. FSL K6-0129]|uniref:large conductance mechanosensitive channel protein MscL n=1 Tax=Cytobacillus sp. FSL K6-0129 TaxID=2921421 RepID=UPI0030F64230